MSVPVFDGHNDVLLRLWQKKSASAVRDFLDGDGIGHIDLPRLKAGGMAGGFFAVFAPDDHIGAPDDSDLNPPLAGSLSRSKAQVSTCGMVELLHDIVRESAGAVSLCTSVADITSAMATGRLAVILHVEGAEAIAGDLDGLQALYDKGLRSLGPVWSRPNVFGHGVPFRFPSPPDTGPGLTEPGKALVAGCNSMGILVDLSHLNEKGFWDAAKISQAPLVATHSNVHAICPSSRNLTDDQLLAIGESGGMVGLNYATGFLRDDGRWTTETSSDVLITHLEHMLRLVGEDGVGLGSDFDGARIPGFIGDSAGVPKLVAAMDKAGFGSGLIEKIAWKNWLRVLQRTWGV